ncbi:hypothetical protein ACK32R_21310 [Aeromonas dhakensis]|uniref:hypothetical protein n=1 Tax=Aeromonas dhakensis TaxID=196024 RepID=UPI0039862473
MSIRGLMGTLLDSFGDTDVITREMLLERAALIREISELCKQTGQFQHAGDRVEEFIKIIDGDPRVEDKLVHAWIYLLDRVASAPLNSLVDGAVILIMPIVEHYLPDAEIMEPAHGLH